MINLGILSVLKTDIKILERYVEPLNVTFEKFEINTSLRQAAFLSQVAHESGRFTHLQENLNYRAETLIKVFPSRFNDTNAFQYAHKPEMIANRAYAGKNGNGDEDSGDGWRFRGRGLIQLTGRDTYQRFANCWGIELEDAVESVETDMGATVSAGWFFVVFKKLNPVADKGDIVTISKRVAGSSIGLDDRKQLYAIFKSILGA